MWITPNSMRFNNKPKTAIGSEITERYKNRFEMLRKSAWTPNRFCFKGSNTPKSEYLFEDLKNQHDEIKIKSNILMDSLRQEISNQCLLTNFKFKKITKNNYALFNIQ